MDKKIFVTGGTGLVGSNLLRLLIEKGCTNIFALRRKTSDMSLVQDLEGKVNWLEGDILDVMTLEQTMQDTEQVYHCAAVVSFDPRSYEQMHKVNVEGTANVVNTALQLDIKKLLHVSSIAALGRYQELSVADENTAWQESDWNTQYAISKYNAELEVWRAATEGLDVAIVNPSVVFGPGQWNKGPGRFFKIVDEGLKFYPTGSSGFVTVEDVVAYMYALMESDIVNERFLLNGENLKYKQVFDKIAEVIQKPKAQIKVTPLLKNIAWRFEKVKSKLLGTSPKVTKETAHNSSTDIIYKNQKSLHAFGIEYQSIMEQLEVMGSAFLKDKQKGTVI